MSARQNREAVSKALKTALKEFAKLAGILLCSAAVGFALIIAAYALPTGRIVENASESVEIFAREGNYPALIQGRAGTVLDNWTDAIMLGEAAYDGREGLLSRALLNFQRVLAWSDGAKTCAENFCEAFGDNGGAEPEPYAYGRYWHGYLVFLKPLLLAFNYGQIRELIGLAQLLLMASVVFALARRGRAGEAASAALAYASLYPPALALSLQYNTVYILTFVQLLIITVRDKAYSRRESWLYHFVLFGCMTSYFDFLTYPLATFGIPMLLLLALYPDSPVNDFWATVKCGLSWAFGYAGMWGSKWLIGSALTGENIIADAKAALFTRSAGAVEEGYTHTGLVFHAIYSNLSAGKIFVYLMALIVLCAAIYACVKRPRIIWGRVLLLCAFMAAPLAWYAVASNHSYVHHFFTYRTLSISVFAAALLALELIGKSRGRMRLNIKERE